MALKDGFRIKETTTTTGTGTLALAGAPATYRTFVGEIGDTNTCLYQLFDADGASWEVGLGTVTSAGALLSRDTILASSNSDAALVLTAGTHTVVNAPVPGFPTGDLDFNESQVIDAVLKAYAEAVTSPASAAGTLDLDLATSNTFEVTLTENVTTLTLSNLSALTVAETVTIVLKQDATGGRTFAFPASIKWAGGTAPTLSAGVSEIDVLTFITVDGGTTWYGFLAGAAFA